MKEEKKEEERWGVGREMREGRKEKKDVEGERRGRDWREEKAGKEEGHPA